MLKIYIYLSLFFSLTSVAHVPRLKFLLENPQNIDHERGYFKGDFSLLKRKSNILGLSNGELENILDFQIQSIKGQDDFRFNKKANKADGNSVYQIRDNELGSWIKALISGLIFNDGQRLISKMEIDLIEDFDQEIIDFLSKYIEETENQQEVSEEVTKEQEEDSLKDVSASDNEELADGKTILTLDEVLNKRFYKKHEKIKLGLCSYGPCYRLSVGTLTMVFERDTLNLRELKISYFVEEVEKQVFITFDNYKKIGGRYNFPKNIMVESSNEKYLILLKSYYLSKRLPRFKSEELPTLELDQIFSI
tara:strand:- start:1797 stop:2717 length:921 start_codon:yes stop_codon:yes gene_type:complete